MLRFDQTLTGIRSGRAFWEGPPQKEEKVAWIVTPPPAAVAPGACEAPTWVSPSPESLDVRWVECPDDGEDEIYQYLLEVAAVDALLPNAPLNFEEVCRRGPMDNFSATIEDLQVMGGRARAEKQQQRKESGSSRSVAVGCSADGIRWEL